MNTLLVLGGARSGKSSYAQMQAEQLRPQRVFVATAEAHDEEMRARIERHVAERDDSWQTVESPLALGDALANSVADDRVVLVDCLTLWLANLMHNEVEVEGEVQKLADQINSVESPLILVSNEVGMGLVPGTELGRRFRDEQGRLNRKIAAATDRVEFVAAGLPLRLKG